MVDKKFNFYNVYKIYYKNVNKSVFFYDYETTKNFRPDLYANSLSIFLINYFGIFYIRTYNFIKNSDNTILETILFKKKPPLKTNFKIKKFFLKTSILNHIFTKKGNKRVFLISL